MVTLNYTMAQIRFSIPYQTRWGEVLCLDYTTQKQKKTSLVFHTENGVDWSAELEIPSSVESFTYNYCIRNANGDVVRCENGIPRHFYIGHRSYILICDRWELDDSSSVLSRTAFTDCIYRRQGCVPAQMEYLSNPYFLLMHAVPPAEGWRWGVLGSSKTFGEWQPSKVKYLQRTDVYEWGLPLVSSDFVEGVQYKYVLVNELDANDLIWEDGPNRSILPQELRKNEAAIQIDNRPLIDQQPWKGAGVVIPVFSLRSKGSFGVGDFGDLREFITWAADTGLSAVQLLPINDTTSSFTWRDSYPYSGISVFALHPLYLDLREWRHTEAYARHQERGAALNESSVLDYEGVIREKFAFLKDLYQEIGAKVQRLPSYLEFCHDNAEWLKGYAQFCVLRDANHTANFRDWKITQVEGDEELEKSVAFYEFIQYLLHGQMVAVHEYARQCGVILKGDLPIGICRDSVPAWTHAPLFHFNGQAGAPPDAFAVKGQNWGFPTYNWEKMSEDGYAWWRSRLSHMGKYFDAYRIDHVLGFFRIWEVPIEQSYGVLGRFRPALPFSIDEIRGFGFSAPVERYAKAHIHTADLESLSSTLKEENLYDYFDKVEDDIWELKPDFATQSQIYGRVPEGKCRDLLLDLVAEVLFIEDADVPHHYHPRIAAQNTKVFAHLRYEDQVAFNALHDNFFYFRHNDFWAEEALKKIPYVIDYCGSTHSMLPCAEDLGMVPSSVKGVLEKLNILSLEIQRMPKEYGVRFGNVRNNPYLSVATIATHDMPPFRLWWTEDREQTQAFWRDVLHKAGDSPEEASPEICEEVVNLHMESGSMLCLLALQDYLAMDAQLRHPHPEMEQINVPANPNQYWQYRMHLNIEDLMQATSFNEKLRAMVTRCGRYSGHVK